MVVGTLGVRPRLPDPPYWRVSLDAVIKVSRGWDKKGVEPPHFVVRPGQTLFRGRTGGGFRRQLVMVLPRWRTQAKRV